MFGLPLAFAAPAVLVALVRPRRRSISCCASRRRARAKSLFPPLRLLHRPRTRRRQRRRERPGRSWRCVSRSGRSIILAMAEPMWNSRRRALGGSGPLLVLIDDGFAGGAGMGQADRLRPGKLGRGGAVRPNRRDRRPFAGRTGHRAARRRRRRGRAARARAGPLRARPRGGAAGDRALSRARAERRNSVDRRRGRARRRERLFGRGSRPSLARSRS